MSHEALNNSSTEDSSKAASVPVWVTTYTPKNPDNTPGERRDVYKGGQGGFFYYSNNQPGGRKVYVQCSSTEDPETGKIKYMVVGTKRKRTKEQLNAEEERRVYKKAKKLLQQHKAKKAKEQKLNEQGGKVIHQLILVSGPANAQIDIMPISNSPILSTLMTLKKQEHNVPSEAPTSTSADLRLSESENTDSLAD